MLELFELSSLFTEQNHDNHSANDVPVKKGKLSHEEDEVRESLGGRPRRQASNVRITFKFIS